jgi:UTP--glucose-1-phosphate uridylyltransferase
MIKNYSSGNMLAIMDVQKKDVSSYGIITPGKILANNITEILGLIEKPSIKKAPSNMAVVGRYIIEPSVFKELEKQNRGTSNEIQLTDAIANRIGKSNCSGYKFTDERFDCGSKLGFIQANIKLSIERDELNQKLKSWLKNEFLNGDL